MEGYFGELWGVRWLLQRGMAAIYLVAFISALNQFRPLLGERGLQPVPAFLKRASFWQAPSLFHFRYSDRFLVGVAWTGILLSCVALLGLSELSAWISVPVWLALWVLYLSIVNVGQTFYGFGWESMLVEAGFFAAFLGPAHLEPSPIPILILRWMLFRVELGAGLIKIRHDKCWRDLTCLYYHHQTQPLPNPLSWYAHRLPKPVHRAGVLFSHFVQLVAPFGLFFPQPVSSLAGAFIIAHQLTLVVTGNYAWLNWLTIVLGLSAFSDGVLLGLLPEAWRSALTPELMARPVAHDIALWLLAGVTLVLSVKPTLNFFSKHQRMNFSYNPLHLVGAYGAFGSVTKTRYEIVIEGTASEKISERTEWREYELRAKPGDTKRRPRQVAPYHLRLDWLMWFLPFSVVVSHGRIALQGYERWFVVLVQRLLEGDEQVLRLFAKNPFPNAPPRVVRARFYRYEYSSPEERRDTGAWWRRTLIGEYFPPVALEDLPL
jgi:hypothetical protein